MKKWRSYSKGPAESKVEGKHSEQQKSSQQRNRDRNRRTVHLLNNQVAEGAKEGAFNHVSIYIYILTTG